MPNVSLITPKEWIEWSTVNPREDNTLISAALDAVYTNTTIYERLDNLIKLYELCGNHVPEERLVTSIKEQAGKFIGIIGNSPNIEETIQKRKEMHEVWPSYLPNTSLRHVRPFRADQSNLERVIQRASDHARALGKEMYLAVNKLDQKEDMEHGVKRLSALEKEEYRIMPSEGLLWQLNQPQEPNEPLSMVTFDTQNLVAHGRESNTGIFILSPQGELFAGSTKLHEFHHSSFQSGGYVAYGGTLRVTDGKLDYIDDNSGHYAPQYSQFFNMLKEFKNRGIIHPETQIIKKFGGGEISAGNKYLNTRGFLGMPAAPKIENKVENVPLDHYEVLSVFMLNSEFEETNPIWGDFAIVMNEYLKGQSADNVSSEHQSRLAQINDLYNAFNFEPNIASKDPGKYKHSLDTIIRIIDENKGLSDDLKGTGWLTENNPLLEKDGQPPAVNKYTP